MQKIQATSCLAGLFGLLAGCPVAAQHLVAGYVVTAGGDSLRGAVRVAREPLDRQRQVRFVPLADRDRDRLRLRLGPAQVRAYGYVRGLDTVRYVSVAMPTGPAGLHPVFLRQLVNGPVQLYERYVALSGRGTATSRREWLVGDARQGLVSTYWWNFDKNAAAFFRACPFLAADLQAGHYRARMLPLIVRRYNGCGAAAPAP
jgi:hypothetical protein